jgi:hypothetical protein
MYIKEKGVAVMKDCDEDNFINAVKNTGLFDITLGLPNKEHFKGAAKCGYNESAICFGEAKAGSMEAYNFSSHASINIVHVERERKGT